MRVLLVNAPIWKDIGFQSNFNPGMGLLYIGAVLRESGNEVRIIDCEALRWWHDDIYNQIIKWKPTHVGISSLSNGLQSSIDISKMIKSFHPEIWVSLGGVGPSCEPERALKESGANSVCVGEGELVVDKVFSIPGIHIGISPPNLDELPFPAYDLLEPIVGGSLWQGNLPRPELNEQTHETVVMWSRGCPHACTFCSKATMPRKYPRLRSPENILEELNMLKKKFGINSVFVYDDELIGMGIKHNEWLTKVCEKISGTGISFKGQGRCSKNFVTSEIVNRLKNSGFFGLMMGCESGSDDVKNAIRKGTTNEDIRYSLETIHKAGIKIYGFWMVGMPEETPAEVKKTEKLIIEMAPYMDWLQVTIFSPLPGSDFWIEAKDKGYLKEIDMLRNWEDKPLLDMPWMTQDQIAAWQMKLYSVFFSVKEKK